MPKTSSFRGSGVRRRKGDKNISRAIPGVAAPPAQAERDVLRHSFQLSRNQGGIRGHDDNDGPYIIVVNMTWNFLAHGHACNAQLASPSIIALRQHTHGVAAVTRSNYA